MRTIYTHQNLFWRTEKKLKLSLGSLYHNKIWCVSGNFGPHTNRFFNLSSALAMLLSKSRRTIISLKTNGKRSRRMDPLKQWAITPACQSGPSKCGNFCIKEKRGGSLPSWFSRICWSRITWEYIADADTFGPSQELDFDLSTGVRILQCPLPGIIEVYFTWYPSWCLCCWYPQTEAQEVDINCYCPQNKQCTYRSYSGRFYASKKHRLPVEISIQSPYNARTEQRLKPDDHPNHFCFRHWI